MNPPLEAAQSIGLGVAVLVGCIIGSFLNVVIRRLPGGESVVFPASRCPSCKTPIHWYDNIPVVSYLVLGGKCRACRWPIPAEYPLVEILNGLLYGGVVLRFGVSAEGIAYMLFASALLALTVIDLHHRLLPDRITLPGIGVGLLAAALILPIGVVPALVGTLTGGALYALIVLLSRGGMGGGDVKLIAMIGAWLGWQAVLLTTLLAATAGSAVGIVLMLLFGKGRKYAVPFGPFLSAGALVSLFWGTRIIDWYMGLGQP